MTTEIFKGDMACVMLKNGEKRFGIILNDAEDPFAFSDGVMFVDQSNVSTWREEPSQELIDVINTEEVDGIDLFMK